MNGRRPDGFDVERPTQVTGGDGGADGATAPNANLGVVATVRAVLSTGEPRALSLYKLADEIVVGRGTQCDWQLEDNSLSRRHAKLSWDGAQLALEDLGSANGTKIGGVRITRRTVLPPGQSAVLGKVTLTLEAVASVESLFDAAGDTDIMGAPAHGDLEELDDSALEEPELEAQPTRIKPTPSQPVAAVGGRSFAPALGDLATRASDRRSELHAVETVVRATPDASTRMAPSPLAALTPTPSHAAETRVAPAPTRSTRQAATPLEGTAGPQAALFRPAQNWAGPDEPTGQWDPAVVTQRHADKLVDMKALRARLGTQWRTNRRPFILVGAIVWVGVILLALFIHDQREASAEAEAAEEAALARKAPTPGADDERKAPKGGGPTVTPLGATAADGTPVASDGPIDRNAVLADGISAYDQGKLDDALVAFKKLVAADPTDTTAKYMVELLSGKAGKSEDGP